MRRKWKGFVAKAMTFVTVATTVTGNGTLLVNAAETVESAEIEESDAQSATESTEGDFLSFEMKALTSGNDSTETESDSTETESGSTETESVEDSGTTEEVETLSDDGDWQFAYFGTSTSAVANTLVDGTGIAAGTDLTTANDAQVSLTSCTYNADGSINKKGGKFVATDGYDGISYYYTKIAAGTENFYLQADVTVDYINPTPDGQEGFALLARDSVGENGVAESAYYTNSCATIGTKLSYTDEDGVLYENLKDIVGYRCFDGLTDTTNAPTAGSFSLSAGGFDKNLITAGSTYTISLEETNSAYIMTYYTKADDGTLTEVNSYTKYKEAEGDDPLEVIDKDYEYVGFAVARGCNATFDNIIFRTSDAATDDPWEARPSEYVATDYQITSPATATDGTYTLVFTANADGVATVTNETTGAVLVTGQNITADEKYTFTCDMTEDTTFAVEFTPDADYKINDYTFLSSYETQTIRKEVSYRSFSNDTIYVTADGSASNQGTSFTDAVDLETALSYAKAGQTIILKAETYTLNSKLKIERGRDGKEDAYITVETDPDSNEYAVFDFNQTGEGLEIWGDYWHFERINVTGSKSGSKGCQLSGHYDILEQMNFYNNGNSGLQISGSSAETIADWPSNNTVLNCTSMNNADTAMEDADGFAAKLTCGEGNVFDGCIAAYNADDGWDFFAKTATGCIGAVTIKNCVAYRNGFLIVDDGTDDELVDDYITANLGLADTKMPSSSYSFDGSNYGTPVINGADIQMNGTVINAGNGNGFKMGGSALSGNHILKNSVSYENKAKGIDSNSCPDIKVYSSTSYNNGNYNVALYSNSKITTDFEADGILSFRTAINDNMLGIGEKISLYSQTDVITTSNTNYFWNTTSKTSVNAAGTEITSDMFENLDTSVAPVRNEDGSIEMNGLLVLTAAAPGNAGANLSDSQADTTLWVVGDSTVSAFSDKYYMPRYGWGTQLSTFLNSHVTVENLAVSGTSSKSFLSNANYQTLLDGMEEGDYLIIGFGHNDEKTGDTTFTSGDGDYQTEGSFANSLYTNYIKVAQEKGVEVILVTPIARRSATSDYTGESGHITEFGDYAQAVRDLGEDLDIPVCDLTAQTIALNTKIDSDSDTTNDSKYMHAWTSKKETSVDNTHTNLFGAAENAYLIATDLTENGSSLAAYVKAGITDPMEEVSTWFEKSINADYVEPTYDQPTSTSETWEAFTDANGNVWYGSVFGDVGSGNTTNQELFALGADEDGNMDINAGITKNTGKIAGSSDGLAMYYTRIPVESSFDLKADVTVKSYNSAGSPTKQAGFGLMVRDDMYVDEYVSTTMGDYVVAGTVFQSTNLLGYNTYARKSGSLTYCGGSLEAAPQAGETVSLEIASTTDGYLAKYGDNDSVISGYDFALTSVDGDYIYVGFFAARTIEISASNIELTIDGVKMENYDSYAINDGDDSDNGDDSDSGNDSDNGDDSDSGNDSGNGDDSDNGNDSDNSDNSNNDDADNSDDSNSDDSNSDDSNSDDSNSGDDAADSSNSDSGNDADSTDDTDNSDVSGTVINTTTTTDATTTTNTTESTVVSAAALAAALASGTDYVLQMDGYTWTIHAGTITIAQNVDLHVTMNGTTAIPAETLAALAGSNEYMTLSLDAFSGSFGFEAALTLNVGAARNGMYGNLYYYNSEGRLEFVDSALIDANGNLTLDFTHASDYVIIFSAEDMAPAAVKTGDETPLAGMIILFFAGALGLGYAGRRKAR